MSKIGGSTPKTATYYVGLQMVLCQGPIDKVTAILVDNRLVWQGEASDSSIYVNQRNIFGGIEREGGIQGYIDFCMGTVTQTLNSYIATKVGSQTPAMRGVVTAVLKNMFVGTNYYLKPWAYLATRIHTMSYLGTAQWFNTYAEVPSAAIYTYQSNINANLMSITHSGNLAIVNFDADCTFTNPSNGVIATMTAGMLVTISGATDSLYNGTFSISGDVLTTTSISYRMTATPANNAIGPIRIQEGGVVYHSAGLINGVHVLRECLTDPTWGLGYSAEMIDTASFELAAITCWNEGLGFSWLWESGSVQDFMDDVLKHIQGNIYQSRITGKFSLNLLRQITSTTDLLVLNSSNSAAIADFHLPALGNLVSTLTIKYVDNETYLAATSIPVTNLALASRQSAPVEKIIEYSGICTLDVAQKIAIRELRQLSASAYSCSISTNRETEFLNKGDAFVLDRPDYIGAKLIMRVVSINLGTQDSGMISINAVQDIFQSATISYISPPTSLWVTPISLPLDSIARVVEEIPYYLYALIAGDTEAQAVPTTSSFFIATSVAPTQACFPSSIATDATGSYIEKGIAYTCGSGTLTTAIDRVATVITLENEVDYQYFIIGKFIQIDNEYMSIISKVDNVFTVLRGILDTIPESHLVGARVFSIENSIGSDRQTYTLGETIHIKLLTVTSRGTLALDDATTSSITFYGRMHRPYPPANLTLNGGYWPTTIASTSITLSWATRNRFQQTSTNFVGYYTGNVTSEVGVTYAYDLSQSNGTIIVSSTGITGTSTTITTSYKGSVILTIWSINANGISEKVTVPFSLI